MMMVDEDGEWFFAALAVGALIGAGSYTASIAFSKGGFDNWSWGGFFQSAGMGAVSGVATAGIGNTLQGMSGFGTEALRAGMHGVTQGGLGAVQGDNFFNGFASGAISSMASSGFQSFDTKFANSKWGGASFGALSGGVGAELSGGNFWRGAGQGATVALLNHYGHQIEGNLNDTRDTRKRAKAYAEDAFSDVSLANSKGDVQKEFVGTSGLGLSLEIAFPKFIVGKITSYTGLGIDFGFFRDKSGFGLYATTKSTKKIWSCFHCPS